MRLSEKKLVLVISSNRSDYGLLEPLMNKFISEKEINFGLVVTGSHLLKKFGYTFNDIPSKIRKKSVAKIKVLESTSASMVKNIAYLLEKFQMSLKSLDQI